jgi:hypothetical protein
VCPGRAGSGGTAGPAEADAPPPSGKVGIRNWPEKLPSGAAGGGGSQSDGRFRAQAATSASGTPTATARARSTAASFSSCRAWALSFTAPRAIRFRMNASSVTADWYSATAFAAAGPERRRTSVRQPFRRDSRASRVTSLGAIQPAAAKPGSCAATIRASRRRANTTSRISPTKIGTITNR